MYLLIDDERDLNCNIICRDGWTGLTVLRAIHEQVTVLCMDHDLGEGINGYQVIVKAIKENILPKEVQIVSANIIGAKRIKEVLIDAGYTADLSGKILTRG